MHLKPKTTYTSHPVSNQISAQRRVLSSIVRRMDVDCLHGALGSNGVAIKGGLPNLFIDTPLPNASNTPLHNYIKATHLPLSLTEIRTFK